MTKKKEEFMAAKKMKAKAKRKAVKEPGTPFSAPACRPPKKPSKKKK
jgi:hypothetical protein